MLLHGVDFSGADAGGAAKIRVVTRDLQQPRGALISSGRMDRRTLLRAILSSQQDGGNHMWRVDAPMGIPTQVAQECGVNPDWHSIARWMHQFGAPRQWRSALRAQTRREPRRACDIATATPMAPMNLRVFKQTWTFICEVLLPLSEAGVGIEPVAPRAAGRVVVCEGCPASVLAAKGWPKRGYKGRGAPTAEVRMDLLRRLRDAGLNISAALAQEAVADEEGDLLDAIILTTEPFHWAVPAAALVEGWVY